MEAPETAALRHFVEQYLAGDETPDTVGPRYVILLAAHYEANYQATRRGEPAIDFFPPHMTKAQLGRMLDLADVTDDYFPRAIEWLPLDEDEAV